MGDSPRRGWREIVEPGLYRSHRLGCASSADRRPGRRCACPFELQVPASKPGRTRSVSHVGTLTEARSARRRLLAAGRPPVSPKQSGAPQTLDDFATSYFRAKSPVLAPSTIKGREEAYLASVSPALGRLPLNRLDREAAEVWLAELLARSSHHAARKALDALRVMLKLAVEWERLAVNPAAGLRLPRRPARVGAAERVLDEGQLALLIASAGTDEPGRRRAPVSRIETMLRAAAEAGLRKGEILGLRWPDVDLERRRLAIERAVWRQPAGDDAPARDLIRLPKGGRTRRVAISASLARRLGDWYAESVVGRGAPADGYVWAGRSGGPMNTDTPGQTLARVLERAGLRDADGGGLVTFHGLRHTAASIMLARSVPLIVVSRQLGHAHPNITAQVYAHLLSDAQLDEAAEAFEPATDAETAEEIKEEETKRA